ncbi:hypothetical protein EG68_08555 [Paragonimus skrjabini miyazakii]|uniref:Cytochrome b5 heme-binding domain-containing protein n=1 Tax=Paragonimus skrjabini miyazakii TaxID=59628 RepID=A0A8S9YUV5_9TREM|nr:hypothetical protein EG68_08555 [Paragonimus skrjabini miyazakii]
MFVGLIHRYILFVLWFSIILGIICALIVFRRRSSSQSSRLPKLPRRDFTLEELRHYKGDGPDSRILMAVNGKVFDVTNAGQQLYAKGAPYASYAGKDVSRALARFSADVSEIYCSYDDLSDLTQAEMNRLCEWELQFMERYDYVGRLLRPGEPHHVYDPMVDDLDLVYRGNQHTNQSG